MPLVTSDCVVILADAWDVHLAVKFVNPARSPFRWSAPNPRLCFPDPVADSLLPTRLAATWAVALCMLLSSAAVLPNVGTSMHFASVGAEGNSACWATQAFASSEFAEPSPAPG